VVRCLLRPLIRLPLWRHRHNGKKVNGRKRHIATETTGLLLVVPVTAASVQDRDGGRVLLWAMRCCFTTITKIWPDGGYQGQLVDWAVAVLNLSVDIVRKLAGQVGFQQLGSLLGGLEVLEPGIVTMNQWRPDDAVARTADGSPTEVAGYCAVARKP
jgi:hypothetical protein